MEYDVVISGAGPSGSQCAQVLAKAGYDVALIEKDTNWRKPCGGALNPSVIEHYPQLKKLNLPKLTGVIMHSADNHQLKYHSETMDDGTIVDRLFFDNFIRDLAVEQGAELFNRHISVDFITANLKKIGIKTKSSSGIKEFRGKILIIADGMSSKLAVKSGLREKWKVDELALAKCAILEGNHKLMEDHAYIFFRSYKGYGWIFPLDQHRFNIGIYTFDEDYLKYNIHNLYDKFLKDNYVQKLIPKSDYKTIWSGAYPFPTKGVKQKSLVDDNVMLVGDTGGFVSPISGEGIDAAIVSGKIAAQTAIKALEIQDYTKNTLKSYKQHSEIKTLSRNYKLKLSMIDFFYENYGLNLNRMLALAETDQDFKEQVVNLFTSKTMTAPSKDFFARISNHIK